MAEKYGNIPKKFTKEWWEYFWMYYKWYVLGTLFALVFIIVTIVQVVTSPKYDQTIVFCGEYIMSEETAADLASAIGPLSDDVDGNGKKNVTFTQISIDMQTDPEYAMSMLQKLNLMIGEEDIYLYILDKEMAEAYIVPDSEESAFIPLDKWLDSVPEDVVTLDVEGIPYGVELPGCDAFKEIFNKKNLDFSNKYLLVRYPPRKDQNHQVDGYNAAIILAQKIVKGPAVK